jgi:hypothetical protein
MPAVRLGELLLHEPEAPMKRWLVVDGRLIVEDVDDLLLEAELDAEAWVAAEDGEMIA